MDEKLEFLSFSAIELIKKKEFTRLLIDLDSSDFPFPWTSGDWDSFLIKNPDSFLTAYNNSSSELIGFTLWSINVVDSFAHLLKILIKKEHRGHGYGRNQLKEALSLLQSKGVKNFYLEVSISNEAAISTYLSLGFQKIHVKKQFYSNGESAQIMTLSV